LLFWLGPAFCARGSVAVQQGRVDEGIAEIESGLAIYEAIGIRATYGYQRSALIEAYITRGAPERGLSLVRELLARPAEILDHFYDAELRRLEGELLRL